jgi:hypothetical protein
MKRKDEKFDVLQCIQVGAVIIGLFIFCSVVVYGLITLISANIVATLVVILFILLCFTVGKMFEKFIL